MSYKTKIERLEVRAGQVVGSGEQGVLTLPEMTDADTIMYLDGLRIPEELAYLDKCLNVTPDARASLESYIQAHGARQAWYRELLAGLKEAYEAGEMSLTDYERITTPQSYSPGDLAALREQVSRFIPRWHGKSASGRDVFQLRADAGWIWLTCENDQWHKHATFPDAISS